MRATRLGWMNWFLAAWLACLCLPTLAAEPLLLDERLTESIPLLDRGEYWLDTSGQATPDQANAVPPEQWRPTKRNAIYPLRPGQALWIRFDLALASGITPVDHWFVEVPYANMDWLSLYAALPGGGWMAEHAGDHVAVADWPLPHRHALLPPRVDGTQPVRHLLRVRHAFNTSVPVLLSTEDHLLKHERAVTLGLGVFFGLTLLALLLTAASAIWLRDTALALYLAPTLLQALTAASFAGVAGLWLWPHAPRWNDLAGYVLPTLSMASMLAFVAEAASLKDRGPALRWAVFGLAAVGVLLAAAMHLLPEHALAVTAGAYATLALVVGLAVPAWAWWRGDRYAPALLVGMLIMTGPAAIHILRALELMPTTQVARYALLLAGCVQLAVILITLLNRNRERMLTQQLVRGLDRVDPATGVASAAVFGERLQRMTARAARHHHHMAVILVDVVNLGGLARAFGRRVRQEMPLHLASRLRQVVRDIDTVGRLSETRFGLLIEGPIVPGAAQEIGERVLARCLQPIEGRPTGWLPRLRVAVAEMPRDGKDPHAVLDQLSVVLDTVPAHDTRALFRLG